MDVEGGLLGHGQLVQLLGVSEQFGGIGGVWYCISSGFG